MDRLDALARAQHGLLTWRQVVAEGLSADEIRGLIQRSWLLPVRHGVYRVRGAALTREQAWLAAVLACNEGTYVSHDTAVAHWGLRYYSEPDRIDLLAVDFPPRGRGVRGHRTKNLELRDVTVHRSIPVTTVARTFIDTCGRIPLHWLGRSLDDALRRKLLTVADLRQCAERVPVSGRRKILPIKALLAARAPGYDAAGSAEELDIMKLLRRHHIDPLPVQQYRVVIDGRPLFLDFAWPEVKVDLEYYGGGYHDTVSAMHDDRARTRRLKRLGWDIWEVTSQTSELEIVEIARGAATASRLARAKAG